MSYMNQAEFAPAGGIQELSFDEVNEVTGGTEILDIKFDLGKVEGSVGVDPKSGDVSGSLSTTSDNITVKVEGSTNGSAKVTVTVRF